MHTINRSFPFGAAIRSLYLSGTNEDAESNLTVTLVNSMCLSIIALNVFLAPTFAIITQSWSILSGAMIEVLLVRYVLHLNAKRKYMAANVTLFLILNAATVYFAAILGRTSSAQFMIFFLAGLCYFLYPDWIMRSVGFCLTLCSFITIELNYKEVFISPINAPEHYQDFIRWAAYLAISTLIILLFSFYSPIKRNRVHDLKEENGRLKKINKGLSRNIEEYEAADVKLLARINLLSAENRRISIEMERVQTIQERQNFLVASLSDEINERRQISDSIQEKEYQLQIDLLQERHANEALNDYLYFAAHDAERNVASIDKAFYYLQEKLIGNNAANLPDQSRLIQFLNVSIEEFRNFISNLFYVAKREAKRIDEVIISDVSTRQFFRKMISMVDIDAALMDKTSISVITSPDIPEVLHTDITMLRQISMNLLINAKQWATGQVIVLLDSSPTHFIFTILNQGPFITENNLSRIFDRDFTTNRTTGKGVGLTIAKSLTNALGGEISVSNQVNFGPKFTVSLPYDLNHIPHQKKIEGWMNQVRNSCLNKHLAQI